jgi:amino acid adenylation domain-containing protein
MSTDNTTKSDIQNRRAQLSAAKRALLERRIKGDWETSSAERTIPCRNPDASSPVLSFAQERLWFFDQLEPGSAAYNIPAALRLTGQLNVEILRRSFNEVVRRHESLRTSFALENERAAQIITPELELIIPVVDLRALPEASREAEAVRLATGEARRPFELAHAPLLRVRLLQLDADEHVLLLTMHHIVGDAWSLDVLVREVASVYEAFLRGQPSPLANLPIQYADYAVWQRGRLTEDALETELRYWKAQLDGIATVLDLPTDHTRTPSQDFKGARESFALPEKLSESLKELSRREGATLFMTLLAAFQTLLGRLTNQDAFLVGTPIANRDRPEFEQLIGFFVNTLVLPANLYGEQTFRELLRNVKETTLGAYSHQELPFERLVRELQPERDRSRNPLVQIIFDLQNLPASSNALTELTLRPQEFDTTTTRFDLELHLWDWPEGIRGDIVYSTSLFEARTVKRLSVYFQKLLEGIVAKPDERLSAFEFLSADERRAVLRAGSETTRHYPRDSSIQKLFEEQAERTPEGIAVVLGEQRLTYRELNRRANQLAHYLRAWGVETETRVGLCLERSPEMIVGLLGILKAGAAYVALDAAYPPERLLFMLDDTQAQLVLTVEALADVLPAHHAPLVLLDAEWPRIAGESAENLRVEVAAENLAYVSYTSGSTGVPKGVAVKHRGVVRLLKENNYASFDESEVFLQFAPLVFDASTFEIWGSLLSGAQLVLMPEGKATLADLAQVIREQAITTLWLTAGLFHVMVDEHLEELKSLRQLLAGGDVLSVAHVRRFLDEAGRNCALINGYGPTESTTFACCQRLERSDAGKSPVPIGRPIANTQVYILDAALRPVPHGFIGELFIGGDGLARGYLNQPELTAEKFLPHPYSVEAGAQLYRTGDLARFLPDGTIEFIGRRDRQVKIRGFRIELGEIEAALGQHRAVRQAVLMASGTDAADKRLVAYVVPEDGETLTLADVNSFLKQRLPEHMLPSAVALLAEMPLSANGKINRQALSSYEHAPLAREESFIAPRTPVEEILTRLWAELLKVERVSLYEDFFELGGHSLLATQLISRVRAHFGVELALNTLFEAPTVAEQAAQVEAALRMDAGTQAPPVVAVPRDENLPLSFAQQRLWFLHELEPSTSAYNIPTAVRLKGRLNAAALEQTLGKLVERHESLRTSFGTSDGKPVQVIDSAGKFGWSVINLEALPESERMGEARRRAAEDARKPFDLTRGPLLRATLMRLDKEEHVLVVTMHHIVSDGWSMGVLVREVAALYKSFDEGTAPQLAPLPIQYADFAHWQRRWLTGDVLEKHLAYWKRQLGGDIPTLDLPTDRPRPAMQSFRGASHTAVYPASLSKALNALCQREGVTLFMLLLAAFKVLLQRYTGQDDIVVGSPIANRNRVEIENLIGFFVNTLVMRTDVSGNPSFLELLRRVRSVALEAYAHQDLPFEQLVEEVQPERSLSRNPLFQVMFQLENTPKEELPMAGVTLAPLEVERVATQFDLSLDVVDGQQGLFVVSEYSTDLFDEPTIADFLRRWQMLLQAIVAAPERRLSDLPLLSDAERELMLVEWNDTGHQLPSGAGVHELFEAQAKQTPDALALIFDEERLTYRELNARANQLAHYLRKMGVGAEMPVGLLMERSAELPVALLAILKAGAAYVPLDPAYPPQRLSFMLRDAHASLVLTQRRLAEKLPVEGVRVLSVDTDAPRFACEPDVNLASRVVAENIAYVIYTSGSTGRPKGVAVTHGALMNHTAAVSERYGLDACDRVLQFASISFDVAAEELFPTWSKGACVVLLRDGAREGGAEFLQFIEEEHLTALNLPAPFWHEWVKDLSLLQKRLPRQLRLVVVGSEKVAPAACAAWSKLHGGNVRLVNAYGTSETCITSTMFEVNACDGENRDGENYKGDSLPIGRPVFNTQLYVLDRDLQLVPTGVAGELYIGGAGLARGYYGRADLTSERFIPHPYGAGPGARLYRTGDLVRYLPDGNVEFLGRSDEQVKLRGYRIELGEVESALARHEAVKEVVVAAREDVAGDKRLVAYATLNASVESASEATTGSELEAEQLAQWQMVHDDEVFNETAGSQDPTFNISGWNSSYTGLPIAAEEMREWVEDTVERILARKPQRILEIGCGTGLLLFRLSPFCASYDGTDFSRSALDFVRRQLQRNGDAFAHVSLEERNADDFAGYEPGSFDAVILNSVAQYFPNVEYLLRVLESAVARVASGGFVFIGDVRSLPLLESFYASVELEKAEESLPVAQLRRRVQRRVMQEEELVIHPAFFDALKKMLPRISRVEITPKRGRFHNELTKYRYQVMLHVGDVKETARGTHTTWRDWQSERLSLRELHQLLAAEQTESLGISGVENARLATDVRTLEIMNAPDCPQTAGALRQVLRETVGQGIDPEELRALANELPYEIRFNWARHDASGRFDVLFERRGAAQASAQASAQAKFIFPEDERDVRAWGEYVNNPLRGKQSRRVVPQLKELAREQLPSYMLPSAFVLLDEMPLTPNGKIDRRALPPPEGLRPELQGKFVAPRTHVERKLADIWSNLLGVSQVGVQDNFFEMGGHSLLATQFVSRVRDAFQVEMPLRQLFEQPTIAGLAKLIEHAQSDTLEPRATDRQSVRPTGIVPLSRQAHRMKRPAKDLLKKQTD